MVKKVVFATLLLFSLSTYAAPVHRMPVIRIQPDGDTLHLFVSGDEYYHRLHDSNNYTIVQHPQSGYWVYADKELLDQDHWDVVATDFVVGRVNPESAGLTPNIGIDHAAWAKQQQRFAVPEYAAIHRPKTSGRNHGVLNNIVIFIRFSDDEEISTPFSSIDAMFNDSSDAAVSLYNYFKTVSYNKIFIPTHFFPTPSGDIVISYQDSLPRNRYMPYNATTNPQGYQSSEESMELEFSLLERAVNYVNTHYPVPTSINLDMDNDGTIDNVCFIVKGTYSGWSDMLWPHKWSLYDREVNINGKRVFDFNFQLEGSGSHYFSTSTFCHEMFHTLGAPDLYRYNNYVEISPVGSWDLMCSNSTPPQQMGAYMKWKYGNWIDSIPEITEPGTYTLHSLGDPSYENCCYKIPTEDPHQWYLFEYRDNREYFEEALPGRGLLIYRINDRFNGSANYDGQNIFDEVYLFRPGASNDTTEGSLAQAYFSGSTLRTEFNHSTNPAPWLTGNIPDSSIFISNISIPDETISFTYTQGNICLKPKELKTDEISTDRATLSWQSQAQSYLLQWREANSEDISEEAVFSSIFELTGLESGSRYYWRVRSVCDTDNVSAFSNWATFTTSNCDNSTLVEIAEGTTNSFLIPISTLFKYSYSQMIFTAEELSGAQTIEKVSFKYNSTSDLETKTNCLFFIGYTDIESFAGRTPNDYIPFNTLQKVYEGPLYCVNGWNEFTFDSVFEYDGVSNLVFCVFDNSGESDISMPTFSCTNTPGRHTTLYCVGINALNPSDISTLTATSWETMRCDIRFRGCPSAGNGTRDDIAYDHPTVTVRQRTITVDDPNKRNVTLYDITGRRICSSSGKEQSILTAPASGIFLLSIDGLPARKIVIL